MNKPEKKRCRNALVDRAFNKRNMICDGLTAVTLVMNKMLPMEPGMYKQLNKHGQLLLHG